MSTALPQENQEREQKIARILLDAKAVKINVSQPFTFASGIRSPIYCDNRALLAFPEFRKSVSDGFIQLITKADIIAGVATAGVPWACFIAAALEKPLAYVRSKPKDHGTGSIIEGAAVQDKHIVLIEDLISTGKSSIEAVKVLKDAGAAHVEVKAIFSYQFEQAKQVFSQEQCSLETLSNFSVLIGLLQKEAYLTPHEAAIALQWSTSPETWYAEYIAPKE